MTPKQQYELQLAFSVQRKCCYTDEEAAIVNEWGQRAATSQDPYEQGALNLILAGCALPDVEEGRVTFVVTEYGKKLIDEMNGERVLH